MRIVPSQNSTDRYCYFAETPDYLYNSTFFPKCVSGGFYVIPAGMLECLYATALETPIFPWNDMYLTGFVASSCGYLPKGDVRIKPGKLMRTFYRNIHQFCNAFLEFLRFREIENSSSVISVHKADFHHKNVLFRVGTRSIKSSRFRIT